MNKLITIFVLCALNSIVGFSQEETSIDRLSELRNFPHYVNDTTIECGDSLYWSFVKQGKELIPELIIAIRDSTPTDFPVPCTDFYLTKGDIALFVLDGITRSPVFQITRKQWCTFTIGCEFNYPEGWFNYINSNREEYTDKLQKWYDENSRKMKTVKIKEKDKTQCQIDHGIEYRVVLK